jgi:surface antigen
MATVPLSRRSARAIGGATGSAQSPPGRARWQQTYELRLFANDGFGRLATSGTFTVAPASLQASPSAVVQGSSVTATWMVTTPTARDWVGVYPSASTADTGFVAWVYTGGAASGSKPVVIPAGAVPGGKYELRLFANDGFTRLATSATFTVATALVQASPSTVVRGGSVTATWTMAAPAALDWMGVYPYGANSNSAYVAWTYTGGTASGSKPVVIPAGTPVGKYELRLFANGGFTRLATSGAFTVATASVQAAPLTVAPSASITATWTIPAPTALDWIGVYTPGTTMDTAYVAWVYTGGTASGSKTIVLPASAVLGSVYELRLFANDSYARLATTAFTVRWACGTSCGTDDYPYSTGGGPLDPGLDSTDEWGFTTQKSESFVAWRLSQRGILIDAADSGDAGNWDSGGSVLSPLGYADTTPTVGAVAQWHGNESICWTSGTTTSCTQAGPTGHVAFVMAVHADGTVDIEQYDLPEAPLHYAQRYSVRAPRYVHLY